MLTDWANILAAATERSRLADEDWSKDPYSRSTKKDVTMGELRDSYRPYDWSGEKKVSPKPFIDPDTFAGTESPAKRGDSPSGDLPDIGSW